MNILGMGVHEAGVTKYGLARMYYVNFPLEWCILASGSIYYVP